MRAGDGARGSLLFLEDDNFSMRKPVQGKDRRRKDRKKKKENDRKEPLRKT